MSSKSLYEIAGEITVAWLNALSNVPKEGSSTQGAVIETLSNQEKVADFYKTIYKGIQKAVQEA